MKKIITLILLSLMISAGAMAQVRRNTIRLEKVEGDTVQINKWLYWFSQVSGLTKVYKDSVHYVQYASDSVRFKAIGSNTWSNWMVTSKPQIFTKVIATDGENNITVSFGLRSTSEVYFNGTLIPAIRWTGVGTTTLALLLETKIYDRVTVKK
jgi:hypothetical protein